MKSECPPSLRSIGDEVAYRDNSEDRILDILTRVTDPSDGSDELAAQIDDWPTRYHCSPKRSNLLRPFKIEPGMKVLEIGAGTGALTRYLAEQGAIVTAIEGTRARAESIVERCRDLDSIEVLCGDFNNFEPTETFDLVLVVGVLEYAASDAGGRSTSSSFLDRVTSCLDPKGVVILAIENQLGLKYLLGGKEDHLGMSWVGIENYPGKHGVRTWGRRTLSNMLSGCGLTNQRWFFPFPDYKTPSSIVAEIAYEGAQAPILIDQWTSPPIIDHAYHQRPIHDDRAAHKVFLLEGLGPEVANSFLVAATQPGGEIGSIVDPDTLLWHFGGDRRRDRRRLTTVSRKNNDLRWVKSSATAPKAASPQDSWVAFHPDRNQPYIEGTNLEQEILDACRRGSSADVEALLDLWWSHLVALEKPIAESPDLTHPYLSASTASTLDPIYLDVQPSNFISTEDGLAFIDREWEAAPAVDAAMVRLRALWYLARSLILSGAPLPWPEETSVQSLTGLWIGRWTEVPDTAVFTNFYRAETALQLEVSGGVADEVEKALAVHGQLSRKDVLAGQTLGNSTSPEKSNRDLVSALQAAMEEAGWYQHSLVSQIEDQKNRADRAEQQFQAAADEATKHQRSLEFQIEDQKNRADRAERLFQEAQTSLSDLEQQASRAEDHISQLERQLGDAAQHIEKVEIALGAVRETASDLHAEVQSKNLEITRLTNEIETVEITLNQTRFRLAEAEVWRREFERHPMVRFYRRLRWWLPQ